VHLKKLKVLWLLDNPVAELPNYREYVLKTLPQLQKLDNSTISQQDRQQLVRPELKDKDSRDKLTSDPEPNRDLKERVDSRPLKEKEINVDREKKDYYSEREQREKQERERDKQEKDKQELRERERYEREKERERERVEREKQDREREREKQEREREREKQEREREREKIEKEREKTEIERIEKERR